MTNYSRIRLASNIELDPKVVKRFWIKVNKTNKCWLWTAGTNSYGYGSFRIGEYVYGAHRVAWFILNGPIPVDKILLHSCDTERCVNPSCIRLGTDQENTDDKRSRGGIRIKLSEANVIEVKNLYINNKWQQERIATKFNCSQTQISRILRGERRMKKIMTFPREVLEIDESELI
jgi:predicted XRE-type DNA-binding protein